MDALTPPPGFISWILSVLAAVIAIGGAWNVVTRMLSPFKALRETAARHEAELKAHKALLDRDYVALQRSSDYDKAVTKALKALLSNAATGNSTGLIKEAERALDQFLIEK